MELYDRVKSVFDTHGIPPEVWYPIAMQESSFDPSKVGDAGASWGLFQINNIGGQGVGFSSTQLLDPIINSEIAARNMQPAWEYVRDRFPPGSWAGEVARRSGHPGGSVANPFARDDPRINAIFNWAQQLFNFVSPPPLGGGGADPGIEPPSPSGDGSNPAPGSGGGGSAGGSGGGPLEPLGGINGAIEDLRAFLSSMDVIAVGITALGIIVVLMALALLGLENKSVQNVISTVKAVKP